MLQARYAPYVLHFTFEARTSRGSMWDKPTYFVEVWDDAKPDVRGLGECNHFPGLSPESAAEFEAQLAYACRRGSIEGCTASGVRFGWQCALAQLQGGGGDAYIPSAWTRGEAAIPINGLIWMGDKKLMLSRIAEKLDKGFKCLKLKIGGISFSDELDLLAGIRSVYPPSLLEIRLDANAAFSNSDALGKLQQLAAYSIHSLEQPIKPGQPEEMARICAASPIPICLDEELIGLHSTEEKKSLFEIIKPQYIILKPALCGGLSEADEWIKLAEEQGAGWWATSALESNIGLSAIAQWVAAKQPAMPQGLGTGGLYSNNFDSPVELYGQLLTFNPVKDGCTRAAASYLWP